MQITRPEIKKHITAKKTLQLADIIKIDQYLIPMLMIYLYGTDTGNAVVASVLFGTATAGVLERKTWKLSSIPLLVNTLFWTYKDDILNSTTQEQRIIFVMTLIANYIPQVIHALKK